MDQKVWGTHGMTILGHFGVFFAPLTPWRGDENFFRKKPYVANLPIEIQLIAKFQKKVMNGYPAIE